MWVDFRSFMFMVFSAAARDILAFIFLICTSVETPFEAGKLTTAYNKISTQSAVTPGQERKTVTSTSSRACISKNMFTKKWVCFVF